MTYAFAKVVEITAGV